MSTSRFHPIAPLLLALLAGVPARTSGQVKESRSFEREMKVSWQGGSLRVSLSIPEVFTTRLRQHLSNGFTSRIVLEVELLLDRRDDPVARSLVQYTILYDIWEERFFVRVERPGSRRDVQLNSMEELVRYCGSMSNLSLLQIAEVPEGARGRVKVKIVVNPLSPEQRRKVREFLANPSGRGHIGSPRSFFGSFSKIFVSEKDLQADAVYTYRSQRMVLPPTNQAR